MNCSFLELKCPVCQSAMESGSTTVSEDVQLVKRCTECEFWMFIVIPNKRYNYTVKRELKP